MIESRDRTTYSHSSHKCSARGSNQHWPERYQDATRQGTVKLGCNYATWRWVHYLHGSSSSGELICLAQGQHGTCCQCHGDRSHDLSIRIPMLIHYVTTLPIYFMLVGLFELMVMSGRCLDFMGLLPKFRTS